MNFPPPNITGLPEPDKASATHSLKLSSYIHELIAEQGGAISFADFMQQALYAPGLGYYVAGQQRFGAEGDFVTAPELGDLFGQCLARQITEVFNEVDAPCDILEFGAGSGKLAASLIIELSVLVSTGVLNAMPENYYILETSADLQQRQKQLLTEKVPQFIDRISWLSTMPDQAITGVVLANEVLDAMPVELFSVSFEGDVLQQCVASVDGELIFSTRPASKVLEKQINSLNLNIDTVSYNSEINMAVHGWLKMINEGLQQGLVLLIDYGFPAREYYHVDRSAGTLMCHYRHHAHSNPLTLVGIQDITAHVNFTAVAEAAFDAGMEITGYTTQANFLLGCGLIDIISADNSENANPTRKQLMRNHEVQLLSSPAEMGELFKVIGLAKNIENELSGFSFRDMRGKL